MISNYLNLILGGVPKLGVRGLSQKLRLRELEN